MKEALFYKKLGSGIVQCELCPHFCTLKNGEKGKCKVRENRTGKLFSLVYEKPCSIALDPIEKKPLYHFYPGSKTLSLATFGCNLSCQHCQNWQISQKFIEKIREASPQEIIEMAKNVNSKIISFTYTEPTIFYEYMLDIAKLAKKEGMKTAMVSNGYINPEPLKQLLPFIDAFNIDLKGNDKFYEKICGGRIQPVLKTIKIIHKAGKHLEITNLLIPGLNDSDSEIKKIVFWIKVNLSDDVPLHFSAFFPHYKLVNVKETPAETVIHAAEVARKLGMKNVHTGNI
ncbi:AmmeMemoRadiSam system radical SAM enzyme [Candidatus Pacearchaeota archaeon]|nr:AmmeMemoRadiSam system radical SAM enzyme [Candidatus Pacearchaeota archaeon]